MVEKITIIHSKIPDFFASPRTLRYEGAVFSNGKVAYMDEGGTIYVSEKQDTLLSELNKHGTARIEQKIKKAKKRKEEE